MSAWIVSKRHIDFLITAALERGGGNPHTFHWHYRNKRQLLTYENATEVGRMLWRENHRSINYRYPDRKVRTPAYTFGVYTGPHNPKAPGAVYKATSCYDYQSCEHPGYSASKAKAFILSLELAILDVLASATEENESTPWGID